MKLRTSFALLAAFGAAALMVGQANATKLITGSFHLEGRQETPPNTSQRFGTAAVQIDTVANTLFYSISHNVTPFTAAHIHGPAPRGTPAGVIIALIQTGPTTFKGTWNFSETQQAQVLSGQTYFNIHSSAFPGGEIRGQIDSISAGSAIAECGTPNCPGWANQATTGFKVDLRENAVEKGVKNLPASVTQGFLVIVDNTKGYPGSAKNPLNWSDVVAFNVSPHSGQAVLMSDTLKWDDAGSALSRNGYSVQQVLNGNTYYMHESSKSKLNIYQAGGAVYNIYSDPAARVPGLSPIGMGILFTLLAGSGLMLVRRRRTALG